MRRIVFFMVILSLGTYLLAQETADVSDGFGQIRLGMSMEDAKQALSNDSNFFYREADLSLVPSTGRPVIETRGTAFIERAVLQFSDDRLYVFTLILDETRLDYFSVFSEYRERYGDPVELDPGLAAWQSETVRLSLERPLTVRYIDRVTFAEVVDAGAAGEALQELTREAFLDQL